MGEGGTGWKEHRVGEEAATSESFGINIGLFPSIC